MIWERFLASFGLKFDPCDSTCKYVCDLVTQAGKLQILVGDDCGRPATLDIQRRDSPELFAFTASRAALEQSDATSGVRQQAHVCGVVQEALHVKADLRDGAYQNMLQRRVEEGAITSGRRSQLGVEKMDTTLMPSSGTRPVGDLVGLIQQRLAIL